MGGRHCHAIHTHALQHDVDVDVCTGATIVLPIAGWERRFILERRFINTAEGDDSGQVEGDDSGQAEGDGSGRAEADDSGRAEADDSEFGVGEDGGGGIADGFYSMMLMSSTHHHFAGLFTIRKPGAPPATQLLVRGPPVSQKSGSSDATRAATLYLHGCGSGRLEDSEWSGRGESTLGVVVITRHCHSLASDLQARTRRPWPTCSCTRPTTRCVAALYACPTC